MMSFFLLLLSLLCGLSQGITINTQTAGAYLLKNFGDGSAPFLQNNAVSYQYDLTGKLGREVRDDDALYLCGGKYMVLQNSSHVTSIPLISDGVKATDTFAYSGGGLIQLCTGDNYPYGYVFYDSGDVRYYRGQYAHEGLTNLAKLWFSGGPVVFRDTSEPRMVSMYRASTDSSLAVYYGTSSGQDWTRTLSVPGDLIWSRSYKGGWYGLISNGTVWYSTNFRDLEEIHRFSTPLVTSSSHVSTQAGVWSLPDLVWLGPYDSSHNRYSSHAGTSVWLSDGYNTLESLYSNCLTRFKPGYDLCVPLGGIQKCPAGKRCLTHSFSMDCEAGYACEQGKLPVVCSANTFSTLGQDHCTACEAGSDSLEGSSECQLCHAGRYSPEPGHACQPCLPGYYCPDTGTVHPLSCSTARGYGQIQCPGGNSQTMIVALAIAVSFIVLIGLVSVAFLCIRRRREATKPVENDYQRF